jgi:hypothetical protein
MSVSFIGFSRLLLSKDLLDFLSVMCLFAVFCGVLDLVELSC